MGPAGPDWAGPELLPRPLAGARAGRCFLLFFPPSSFSLLFPLFFLFYLTAKTDRFLMVSKESILTPQGGLGGSRADPRTPKPSTCCRTVWPSGRSLCGPGGANPSAAALPRLFSRPLSHFLVIVVAGWVFRVGGVAHMGGRVLGVAVVFRTYYLCIG